MTKSTLKWMLQAVATVVLWPVTMIVRLVTRITEGKEGLEKLDKANEERRKEHEAIQKGERQAKDLEEQLKDLSEMLDMSVNDIDVDYKPEQGKYPYAVTVKMADKSKAVFHVSEQGSIAEKKVHPSQMSAFSSLETLIQGVNFFDMSRENDNWLNDAEAPAQGEFQESEPVGVPEEEHTPFEGETNITAQTEYVFLNDGVVGIRNEDIFNMGQDELQDIFKHASNGQPVVTDKVNRTILGAFKQAKEDGQPLNAVIINGTAVMSRYINLDGRNVREFTLMNVTNKETSRFTMSKDEALIDGQFDPAQYGKIVRSKLDNALKECSVEKTDKEVGNDQTLPANYQIVDIQEGVKGVICHDIISNANPVLQVLSGQEPSTRLSDNELADAFAGAFASGAYDACVINGLLISKEDIPDKQAARFYVSDVETGQTSSFVLDDKDGMTDTGFAPGENREWVDKMDAAIVETAAFTKEYTRDIPRTDETAPSVAATEAPQAAEPIVPADEDPAVAVDDNKPSEPVGGPPPVQPIPEDRSLICQVVETVGGGQAKAFLSNAHLGLITFNTGYGYLTPETIEEAKTAIYGERTQRLMSNEKGWTNEDFERDEANFKGTVAYIVDRLTKESEQVIVYGNSTFIVNPTGDKTECTVLKDGRLANRFAIMPHTSEYDITVNVVGSIIMPTDRAYASTGLTYVDVEAGRAAYLHIDATKRGEIGVTEGHLHKGVVAFTSDLSLDTAEDALRLADSLNKEFKDVTHSSVEYREVPKMMVDAIKQDKSELYLVNNLAINDKGDSLRIMNLANGKTTEVREGDYKNLRAAILHGIDEIGYNIHSMEIDEQLDEQPQPEPDTDMDAVDRDAPSVDDEAEL